MAGGPHALDILLKPADFTIGTPSIIVIVGGESFLSWQILSLLRDRLVPDEEDRGWAWREFAGDEPLDARDVFDEAATVPLFASATRAAVVRKADAFVTTARGPLEEIASAPRGSRGLVILDVKSFPATTRLAKAAAKHGLVIDTSIPPRKDLASWIASWAEAGHGIKLARATAERLLERVGGSLGLADQALARLAAATPPGGRSKTIQPEAIDEFAGTPGERSAWGMIDAAATGDAAAALAELAALLEAGENPIAITAQASSVLRKISSAARLLALPTGQGRPAGVEQALREAGVAAWPKAQQQAADALRQLGAARARRLPIWLRDLDLALKGDASRGLRSRLALEHFFCRLTRQTKPARPGRST